MELLQFSWFWLLSVTVTEAASSRKLQPNGAGLGEDVALRQWERTLVWAAAWVLSLRRMRTRTSSGSVLSRSSPAAAAAASSEESLTLLAALSPPPPSSIESGDGMVPHHKQQVMGWA